MKNYTCSVCEVPMLLVQTIDGGPDDVILYRCHKCHKEIFIGKFSVSPPVVCNGSETRRIGFGQMPTSSTSHKGGVW